jgi:hypothetical protein
VVYSIPQLGVYRVYHIPAMLFEIKSLWNTTRKYHHKPMITVKNHIKPKFSSSSNSTDITAMRLCVHLSRSSSDPPGFGPTFNGQ